MITDKFLMVDANDSSLGWETVTETDMLMMYVGTHNPLTGFQQRDWLVKQSEEELDFMLSLSFCVLSDRDLLERKCDIPFYKVSNADELAESIEKAKVLWLA